MFQSLPKNFAIPKLYPTLGIRGLNSYVPTTALLFVAGHLSNLCDKISHLSPRKELGCNFPSMSHTTHNYLAPLNKRHRRNRLSTTVSLGSCKKVTKSGHSFCKCEICSATLSDYLLMPRSYSKSSSSGEGIVPKAEMFRFFSDVMMAVGTPEDHATIVAENLLTADNHGHRSHGLNRLGSYANAVKKKAVDPCAKPEVYRETAATAAVTGNNGLGAVIGKFSMELAINKAKCSGAAVVTAKESNHYGVCAYYALMAINEGMIGFTCTNTTPLMTVTRAKESCLGTNPISLGGPAGKNDRLLVDMSTTNVSVGKIELAKITGTPIGDDWALGPDGRPTTDTEVALKTKCLLPLGGMEETQGYKGYGLGLMVEILSGILAGSNFGKNVISWKGDSVKDGKPPAISNVGSCFMAIHPEKFGCDYECRMLHLLQQIRGLPVLCKNDKVLAPGDMEIAHAKLVDKNGGITYPNSQLKSANAIAEKYKVEPLKVKSKKKSC